MNKPYQLIIFDWDGTLVDSADDIVRVIQQSIAAMNLPSRDDMQIRRMIGLGLEDAFSRLFPMIEKAQLMAVANKYRSLFGNRTQVYGHPFEGVETVLDDLVELGYRLAVATGKSRRGLDKALAANAWAPRFVATRCADETAGKPNPKMLQELLHELKLSPAQALMVGDTSYDMDMAAQLRMDCVGVAWGVHEPAELQQAGALSILPGVNELSDWLQQR
ncbi:MAG: HAD family hydrolase [Oceanococcus sp.]